MNNILSLCDALILFLGSFMVVFLLGIQSKNVIAGRYIAAILTSAGISVSQFIFVKYAASGSLIALSISTLGGCCGIGTSIYVYKHFIERKLNDKISTN